MRILTAEDDLTSRTILNSILKKWGYDIVAVNDGLAAWEALQQADAPRLIILDWEMPGMNGLELIRRVRAELIEQPPYIILLTGREEKGDIRSGLETGANDYIKKPFDLEELYARVLVGQRTVDLQTSLYDAQQSLAHLATHDPLTGILNRRAIITQFSKELARTRRSSKSGNFTELSIGFLDIDHFKQINDQFGHQAGDEVLKRIANIIENQLRPYDSFGRLGGDEFLVVTPGIGVENCLYLFERLAVSIAGCRVMTQSGEVSVTASIGVASVGKENEFDKLLAISDAAMYEAKRAGGNRVVI